MENRNKKIVMFDFDGVLVNTLEHSYQIHKIKNPNFTWEKFQSYSDGNFHDGYNRAVEDGEHIPADDFPTQYQNKLAVLNIHDALHKAVLELSVDHILVIVSSSRDLAIKEFLVKENLVIHFNDIFGTDIHLSKVTKINTLLEKYQLRSEDAVFITDTLGDIKEANECGVKSIGVTWGLHSKDHMEKGNPVAIIDDPEDLLPLIRNVLK